MNSAAEARQSELDGLTDAVEPSLDLAGELFAVSDLLASQPALRSALSDPTPTDGQRQALARTVFGGRISDPALKIVEAAAALRWSGGGRLIAALERQGRRVLFATAQADGRLDAVEEELFRFWRTVVGDAELRLALDDANAPLESRLTLVSDLLTRADPATVMAARRAVQAGRRGFETEVDACLRIAAAARNRAVAMVTVARPLTAEQADRLRGILVDKLHRPVSLQVVIDPAVIGGVRVRVGDEIIEGTLAGRLAAAREQLSQ